MTENKKKTTKKEVVENNEAPIREAKRPRTKEKSEDQDVTIDSLITDEAVTANN